MTAKEALEMIKFELDRFPNAFLALNGTWKTCVKALEKQIPKKVKIKKYAPTRCNCGFEFSVHYGDGYYNIPFELKTPYCRNCGQALDWSDKND